MVEQDILDALEDVRDSGKINMMDKDGVQYIANGMEHHHLVTWIEEADMQEYTTALEQMGQRA